MKKFLIILTSLILICLIGGGIFYFVNKKNNEITYTLNDFLPDGEGKSAKVILLGGQSNASGCSHTEYLEKNVSEEKFAEYEAGYDNVYINYFSSGQNQSVGFVKCATNQGEAGGCFGPELGMAERLNQLYPDETFFIIKWAWGGTDLHTKWLSPSSKGKTGDLYKHFVAYVNASLEYLEKKNYDIKIEGMCWMQGESDSFSVEDGNLYAERLTNLIKDLRKEFSDYADSDGIAFIDATIADNPIFWVYCDLVNASKESVAKSSTMHALIDTNAEGLICTEEPQPTPDIPHYDSMSEIKLGHLFIDSLSQFMQ